ncbi:ribosome quality control complex subunit TCF25-like isoform X2 [Zophobas morio]|uniref:ribosome quality control complex subunit TCF25-like isoform X2 n=1 Tax=Zophobas morio TaxID=2755281 RepID=UPI003083BA98
MFSDSYETTGTFKIVQERLLRIALITFEVDTIEEYVLTNRLSYSNLPSKREGAQINITKAESQFGFFLAQRLDKFKKDKKKKLNKKKGKFYNQQQQYLLNQKRVEAKEFKKKAQGLKLSMKSIDNALTLLSDRTFKDPTPYKVVNKKKPSLIAFTPNAVFPAFQINKRLLNCQNEIEEMFCSRARFRNTKTSLLRTCLTLPENSWPKFANSGLFMEVINREKDLITFRFRHKREYAEMQRRFFSAVVTLDPQIFKEILLVMPYHVDTLLHLSEFSRAQSNEQDAIALNDRALYTLELSLHASFNLATSTCRLPYKYYENRAMHIALFRRIDSLNHKVLYSLGYCLLGCHKTALETCKLLLSLDEGDPMGCLLMLDFYAIKAKSYHFLKLFYETWKEKKSLDLLPNFNYSLALAEFLLEKEEMASQEVADLDALSSSKQLQRALLLFPGVALPLFEKCGFRLKRSCSDHSYFKRPALQETSQHSVRLLEGLYVIRAHSLWGTGEVMSWLEHSLLIAATMVDSGDPMVRVHKRTLEKAYGSYGSLTVYRHVAMTGAKEALDLLPPSVLQNNSFRPFDPLTPADSVNPYDNSNEGTPGPSTLSSLWMFFRSLWPSYTLEDD